MDMERSILVNFSHSRHEHPSQEGFFRHIHEEYELLYFVEGDAEYVIESAVYRLKKGDLLLIKPRAYHYLKLLTPSPYERFVINFKTDGLPTETVEFLQSAKELYSLPDDSFIHSLFREWKTREKDFSQETNEFFAQNVLGAVLTLLKAIPNAKSVKPEKLHDTLKAIMAYIENEPTAKICIPEVAEKFFVSPSWIVHTFQKELGISFSQYVGKKKMLYAKQLLTSGLTPTQAAEQCGFFEYSTFYRQYKKHWGTSPKEDVKR